METETAQVPLSALLSLHLRLPLTDGPDQVFELVMWMSRGTMTDLNFPPLLEECTTELRRQHPWLNDIVAPPRHDSVWMWAWLDTQERRHGAQHPVTPFPEDYQPPEPPATIGFLCESGHLHGVRFEDLPESLQQYLHSLGYQG
jgi:hypothetical protein